MVFFRPLQQRLASARRSPQSAREAADVATGVDASRVLARGAAHNADVTYNLNALRLEVADLALKHEATDADLAALVAELEVVKADHAHRAKSSQLRERDGEERHQSIVEQFKGLEAALGQCAGKHAEGQAAVSASIDALQSRLSLCESRGSSLSDLQKVHACFATNVTALAAKHTSLSERMAVAETKLGDTSASKLARLEQVHSSKCEERLTSLSSDLDFARARFANSEAAFDKQCISMKMFMEDLETRTAVSASHHASVLETATKLDELQQRVSTCEKQGGAAASAGQQLRAVCDELVRDACGAQERIGQLERALGSAKGAHMGVLEEGADCWEILDKHSKALEDLHGKLDHACGRTSPCEAQHASAGDLDSTMASITGDEASVLERLEDVERRLGESAKKHAQELEASHARFQELQSHAWASAMDRLEDIDRRCHEAARQCAQDLDATNGKIDQLRSQISASTMDRLEDIDRRCHEAARQCAQDLDTTNGKIDQLRSQISAHEASVVDRIEEIDRRVNEFANRRTRELEVCCGARCEEAAVVERRRGCSGGLTTAIKPRGRALRDLPGGGAAAVAAAAPAHLLAGVVWRCPADGGGSGHARARRAHDLMPAGPARKSSIWSDPTLLVRVLYFFLDALGVTITVHTPKSGSVQPGKPIAGRGEIRLASGGTNNSASVTGECQCGCQERLDRFEGTLGDLAGRHTQDVKERLDRIESVLDDLRGKRAKDLEERFDALEKIACSATDLHTKALDVIDVLYEQQTATAARIDGIEKAVTKVGPKLGDATASPTLRAPLSEQSVPALVVSNAATAIVVNTAT